MLKCIFVIGSSKAMFSPYRDRLYKIENNIGLEDHSILQSMLVNVVSLNSWWTWFGCIPQRGELCVKVKTIYGRAYPETCESKSSWSCWVMICNSLNSDGVIQGEVN